MSQKYKMIFVTVAAIALATEAIASHRLACFYFDRNNPYGDGSIISSGIASPALSFVWAKDHTNKDIQLNGKFVGGFFEVSDISQQDARNLCTETLKALLPKAQIQLMHMAIRPWIWSEYIPAVFPKSEEKRFNKLVIFGDSLSDQGRLRDMTKVIPRRPYFAGRFSNGRIWVDYFQEATGLSVQNYAVAGSLSGPFRDIDFNANKNWTRRISDNTASYFSGTIRDQLRAYRKKLNEDGIQSESTLFLVWAGSNDYLTMIDHDYIADLFLDDPDHALGHRNIINHVTDNIVAMITDLYTLGARNFLIPNLPNLGKIPKMFENGSYAKGEPEEKRLVSLSTKMHFVTEQHNTMLQMKLERLKSNSPGMFITLIDIARDLRDFQPLPHLEREISYNGFSVIIGQAYFSASSTYLSIKDKATVRPNQDVFFLDAVHPTSFGHCILASFIDRAAARDNILDATSMEHYMTMYRLDWPKHLEKGLEPTEVLLVQ